MLRNSLGQRTQGQEEERQKKKKKRLHEKGGRKTQRRI